jgi:SM-20-related protein
LPHPPEFSSWIDPARLAPVFRERGRMHLPDILDAGFAEQLFECLASNVPWSRTVSIAGRAHSERLDTLSRAPKALQRDLAALVAQTARTGFQYEFESWRLSDEIEAPGQLAESLAPSEALYDLLNGEAFLGFVRCLTEDERPAYCDAQATRYRAGHFLNTHDDELAGKDRLYAYVLSFTPTWKVDWGGLLLFHDADGHVAEGLTPRFNTLNIFRVPQVHSVSQVASFVTADRLSVTGWIRAAGP